MAMEPRIVFSPLGKRWYVVTRYRYVDGTDAVTGEKNQYLRASVKHDVTEQMQIILSNAGKRAVERGLAPTRVKTGAR